MPTRNARNARNRQAHAYSQSEIDSLMGVPIPTRIRCGRCERNLPQTQYSTRQLTDLRWQVRTAGNYTQPINCRRCTGEPLVEIECFMCHKTKGLEEFAKSQRCSPDHAQCFKCTEELVTRLPPAHRGGRGFVTPDTANGHTPDYWTSAPSDFESSGWSANGDANALEDGGVPLSQDFQRGLSISGSTSGPLIETDSEVSYQGRNGINDGWSEARSGHTGSWHTGTRSTAAGSGINSNGFNPNAYGRPLATSNAGTQRSYPSSVAEHSEMSGSRQFPRVRAFRPGDSSDISAGPVRSPFVRPAGDTTRELDQSWQSDSEEEDDDDDDDSDGDNTTI
ncbi:hypothetical protein HBH53_146050 [Parastagonospora nodorum]|nr:hypothetical protein HBH53_146050 [Parastagonospora nodorum]KAH4057690.1 hypothetical protein HBH50_236850 [Parastagonospora nodorum]KAH4092524.1 hypothetical protein HBH48_087490 [Parastagonospora nodorum]KAH4923381.1 hypothetical protein HBI79_171960 [Parastagonospora nodorum]KAH5434811.1 hypothetical protein HBI47_084740 [Parastagonospora nodorum]